MCRSGTTSSRGEIRRSRTRRIFIDPTELVGFLHSGGCVDASDHADRYVSGSVRLCRPQRNYRPRARRRDRSRAAGRVRITRHRRVRHGSWAQLRSCRGEILLRAAAAGGSSAAGVPIMAYAEHAKGSIFYTCSTTSLRQPTTKSGCCNYSWSSSSARFRAGRCGRVESRWVSSCGDVRSASRIACSWRRSTDQSLPWWMAFRSSPRSHGDREIAATRPSQSMMVGKICRSNVQLANQSRAPTLVIDCT